MRVAFFLDAPYFGGAEYHIFQLLTGLPKCGRYEMILILPPALLKIFRARGSLPVGIETWPFRFHGPLDFVGYWRLFRFLRQKQPALLHINLPGPHRANYSAVAAVAKLAGVPRVVTTEHLPMSKGRLFERVLKFLFSHFVDRVITVSYANKGYLERLHRIPPNKIIPIHSAVDRSLLTLANQNPQIRTELGISSNEQVILSVGSLQDRKGFEFLVRAAVLVEQSCPRARFLIAGDGPLRANLQSLARELAVAEKILFLGFRTDIPRLLEASDLFVMSSLYEGFPLALLEAMAAGKASIATAVNAIPEAIENERTGLLVPSQDEVALARAIVRLLKNPDLASKLGRSARQTIREHFLLDQMVAKYAQVYTTLAPDAERAAA